MSNPNQTHIPTREEAWSMLTEFNQEPFHLKHALAVEAVMRHYALQAGLSAEEVDFWGVVGLLHDIDFERWPETTLYQARELLEERISPRYRTCGRVHGHGHWWIYPRASDGKSPLRDR
jgi:predicted hydrolase (HD superfamily)